MCKYIIVFQIHDWGSLSHPNHQLQSSNDDDNIVWFHNTYLINDIINLIINGIVYCNNV